MILPGDGVIVALSGGADSVCLLVVLKKLAQLGLQCQSAGVERQVTEPETEKEHPCFALRAVHVNHGIRGAEADRDGQSQTEYDPRQTGQPHSGAWYLSSLSPGGGTGRW